MRSCPPTAIAARSTTNIPPATSPASRPSEETLEFVTSQNIAAIMVETIPVPGGMIVPPKEWLPRLAEMTKRWGAVLILDECQLAPARTGKMWAMEHYDVTPDIVTFGKGLSAGSPSAAPSRRRSSPSACAATAAFPGPAPIRATRSRRPWPSSSSRSLSRDKLAERSEKLGASAEKELLTLKNKYACIGDVRGKGLYRMLDIVKDDKPQHARSHHGRAHPPQLRARRGHRRSRSNTTSASRRP